MVSRFACRPVYLLTTLFFVRHNGKNDELDVVIEGYVDTTDEVGRKYGCVTPCCSSIHLCVLRSAALLLFFLFSVLDQKKLS